MFGSNAIAHELSLNFEGSRLRNRYEIALQDRDEDRIEAFGEYKDFECSTKFYDMFDRFLNEEFVETEQLKNTNGLVDNFSWRGKEQLEKDFKKLFGENAYPVSCEAEVNELEHLGMRGIVIKAARRHLLQGVMGSFEKFKQTHSETVTKIYDLEELEQSERDNFGMLSIS